jgi:hypothetical protein
MIRRYPLIAGAAGIALILAVYVFTARPLKQWLTEQYFQNVEKRLASDRRELLPPRQIRHFGMFRPELPQNLGRFYQVGRELDARPTIVAYYQAWGDGPAHEFNAAAVESLLNQGLVPMITWEPWLTSFERRSASSSPPSLSDIVQGRFDLYIRNWARAAVRVKRPFFLRPFHEMGNPSYPWSTASGNGAETIVAAWRHVVSVFRREGATNVAFVWTPFQPEDVPAWPGEAWVDWIGIDLFNYGTLLAGGTWQSFRALLSRQLEPFRRFTQPIMLAEVGCSGFGGDCVTWWAAAMQDLSRPEYASIAAFVAFDHPLYVHEDTTFVDWGFTSRPATLAGARIFTRAAGFLAPKDP